MANNEQNTYAGGNGALQAPSGNSFLDLFYGLANVGITGYGVYEDSRDRKVAREIELANATRPPIQPMPASQANSPADYMSNPQSTQAMIFYGVAFILIGGLSILALKKL